jgi:hypothetical protein
MNNPRNILSEEDVKFLEQNDIKVPNKDLEDEEWLEFEMEISKKLKLDDVERIMDILDDSTK